MDDPRTTVRVSVLVCLGALAGCGGGGASQSGGEKLPLKAGDYFEYHDVADDRVVMTERIELERMSESRLRYRETGTVFMRESPDDVRANDVGARDYVLDECGTILGMHDGSAFSRMGKEQVQGRLIKLWLPKSDRQVGKAVEFEGFPRPLKVTDRMEWMEWEAWQVSFGDHTFYFDVNTGFLVGRAWGGQRWVLYDSSVPDLPTAQDD